MSIIFAFYFCRDNCVLIFINLQVTLLISCRNMMHLLLHRSTLVHLTWAPNVLIS
jgi:hypothetical protein